MRETMWYSCLTLSVFVCVSWRRCFQASASRCLLSGGSKTTMTPTSWKTDSWDYRPFCKTWLHTRTLPTGMWHDYAAILMFTWNYSAFLCKLCALQSCHLIVDDSYFLFTFLFVCVTEHSSLFKNNNHAHTFMSHHLFSLTAWQWESFCVWMTHLGLLIVWRRAE